MMKLAGNKSEIIQKKKKKTPQGDSKAKFYLTE